MNNLLIKAKELLNEKKYAEVEVLLTPIADSSATTEMLICIAEALFLQNKYDLALSKLLIALRKEPQNSDISTFIEQINTAQKNDPFLTLSMIVKNEGAILEECLESVVNIVDEIVITDTGSTDNTIEIAEKYGAKIYHLDWTEDFATARNNSLKHSTGKWILYLDADEKLAAQSVLDVRDTLRAAEDDCGGFVCRIDNAHSLDDSGVMSGSYPRLFRNIGYPDLHFFGKIHEQISPSVFDKGYSVYPSSIVINHKGYNIPREKLHAKMKNNLNILSQHTIEEPSNGYAWYQLGQTLAQMGLFKESQEALNSALKCNNLSQNITATVYLTLSNLSRRMRLFENSLVLSEKAHELSRDKVPTTHAIAIAHLMLGNGAEAEAAFTALDSLNKDTTTIRDYKLPIPQVAIDKGIQEARTMQGLPTEDE